MWRMVRRRTTLRTLLPILLSGFLAGIALGVRRAEAIVGADTGVVWVQAPWKNRIELTNILSRELGGVPSMYLRCVDRTFRIPAAAHETILAAAQACRAAQRGEGTASAAPQARSDPGGGG